MPPLQTSSWSNGGDAVARDPSGRVVFVSGALPNEVVEVELRSEHKRHARAEVVGVLKSSPDRVEPTCPHVAAGCGGCDTAHVSAAGQREYASTVVRDALERTAGLADPVVELARQLPDRGYRTTLRCVVSDGRAAYRRAGTNDPIAVGSCEIAHELVEELVVDGRYGSAHEVTLRAGVASGERMALCSPTADGVELPDDVLVVGADEVAAGRRAWIHEEVAGRVWRVSAGSFFQSRPDGASLLVDLVSDAVSAAPAGPLVDLYAGVGLFAGAASAARPAQAVESNRSAVADARHNLAPDDATVVACPVARWKPKPSSVVVADPPRSGLQRVGVDKVVASGPALVVLVSCDVGSMGRDVGLLTGAGYEHLRSTVVTMFPQTSHVEVVTVLRR